MADAPLYRTEAEIDEVVCRFEACSFTPEEFVHARHLTVAAVYLVRFDKVLAKARMRDGLRKFIKHHGKNGYHVTITEFWLSFVEREIAVSKRDGGSIVALVNELVARCRRKDTIHEYYSRELLSSLEAKTTWLEPDLKPIPSEN